MSKGVVVDLMPVAMNKSTHQEEERGLRLMEVGDEHLYYLIVIAWGDDNLSAGVEDLQVMCIHPVSQGLKTIEGSTLETVGGVGLPL